MLGKHIVPKSAKAFEAINLGTAVYRWSDGPLWLFLMAGGTIEVSRQLPPASKRAALDQLGAGQLFRMPV